MLKRLVLVIALCCPSWAAITFANHTAQGSSTGNGFTTTAYDSTAGSCNFLVVLVTFQGGAATPTLSDSQSNTWNALTAYDGGASGVKILIEYAFNPSLSASHTFSVTGSSNFPSIFVEGFSGMLTTSGVFQAGTDSGAHQAASVGTTIQPGSITPGNSPALVVTGFCSTNVNAAPTVNSGFTRSDSITITGGQHYGGSFAYLIQSTAAAVNPTWTQTITPAMTTDIAAFQGSSGAAATSAASKMKKLQKYGEVPF